MNRCGRMTKVPDVEGDNRVIGWFESNKLLRLRRIQEGD